MVKKIVLPVTDDFEPEIIVTQLGVDTHYRDPLSNLRLTLEGYGKTIREVKNLSKKWIALGGGGYNLEIVPRAWTLTYSIMRNIELDFTGIYEEESADLKGYHNQSAKYFADTIYGNLKEEISEYFSI